MNKTFNGINNIESLAVTADYSLLEQLTPDPEAKSNGEDFYPRQVFSGHYVPVKPTPIKNPIYVSHSKSLFSELGLNDELATNDAFIQMFSGDLSALPEPMRRVGWATGYALSIYGTEYIQQCPFQTGNGYGDGRAVSVFEGVLNGQRWEMQLKGGGRTPYCRGADGRAVLRSSVREFLAQEHMHALGVASSRSLCLISSTTETVDRPWYSEQSDSFEPDIMVENPVAITTRVAPSFLRVGQLELFARRARNNAHEDSMQELENIVLHLIEREYKHDLDEDLLLTDKVLLLAEKFRDRLTSLVTDWLRVGYCQGNFNSDNCALGGFTLDYGPFGFCEKFDPVFQPWTGGGRHFSFFNQPAAAQTNFNMFCKALQALLNDDKDALDSLEQIRVDFAPLIEEKIHSMWARKLGLDSYDSDLFVELITLMAESSVDYTIFFRTLCDIPNDVADIQKCFYQTPNETLSAKWEKWLAHWRTCISDNPDLSLNMKKVNPKYTWREWLVVPAYEQAMKGDFSLISELQEILSCPYDEQSPEVENKYYRLTPAEYMNTGGVSFYSCSS